MKQQYRANLTAFRRAVWASVAFHVVAACVFLLLLRTNQERKPLQPKIDTRAADEPQVRMHVVEVTPSDIETRQVKAAPQSTEPTAPQATKSSELATQAAESRLPRTQLTPQTLPSEMIALIRKPVPQAVGEKIVEEPVPSKTNNTRIIDTNVKPAAAVTTSANTKPANAGTSTPAIHGALKSDQTIVYILDCSGSMGEAGKFDAARAALVSTLKQQPTSVRFQVIVYSGNAVPLLASGNSALPAGGTNIRSAETELAKCKARGKSNHLDAIRVALAFNPDVILILSDADELNVATLKRLLATATRPTQVCVGRVTSEGVQAPREVK